MWVSDSRLSNLTRAHVLYHVRGTDVPTLSCICGKCGKLYLTEQEVKDHMDSDHTNVVLCDICDPKFSTIDAMTVHKEATHVRPPHKIQCSKCDFKTNLMTSYWAHKLCPRHKLS